MNLFQIVNPEKIVGQFDFSNSWAPLWSKTGIWSDTGSLIFVIFMLKRFSKFKVRNTNYKKIIT